MYIKDNIAYADETRPVLCVLSVQPLEGHALQVRFNDGTQSIVDMSPLLPGPVFSALRDTAVFSQVYVEHGIPMWLDGEIDISPEWLRANGQPMEQRDLR